MAKKWIFPFMHSLFRKPFTPERGERRDEKAVNDMARKSNALPCSFTIEAACSLTLFIFCSVVLMVPMLILNQHQNASTVMEESARAAAKYKYIEYYGKKTGFLKMDPDLLTGLETGVTTLELSSKVTQKGMTHVDLLTESVVDEESVKYVLNYEAQLPFRILGLRGLQQQVVAYRRGWIGADGERWENKDGSGNENDPTVYISTKRTTVYHTTLDCTYITHEFFTASAAAIDGQPTQYGGKFSPCESCKPSPDSPTVYYTDGGKKYHSTPTCRAMQSYIQETTLSQALQQGRHACVRCG